MKRERPEPPGRHTPDTRIVITGSKQSADAERTLDTIGSETNPATESYEEVGVATRLEAIGDTAIGRRVEATAPTVQSDIRTLEGGTAGTSDERKHILIGRLHTCPQ